MDRIDNISTKYKQKFPTLDIKYNLNDVANFQEDLSSDENDKR